MKRFQVAFVAEIPRHRRLTALRRVCGALGILVVLLALFCGSAAHGDSLVVPNFSFEEPAFSDGGGTSGPNTIPSWSGEPATGIQMGVENPFSSRYDQIGDVISDPHAEGKQYGYINTFGPDEYGSLTSDPIATVEAGTRYTLTVSVGHGLDINPSFYIIELLVDGIPAATTEGDGSSIPPGTFAEMSSVFDASGSQIGGALQIRLTHSNITGISQPIQGHFDNVRVTASPPSTPTPTPTPIVTAVLNISTRLAVGTGDNVLINGFIVTGALPKEVLIRALGPSLPVSGKLADPTLELHEPDGTTITNNNWKETQETAIAATGIPPKNDPESAILATLAPGAYTAIVSGQNNTTGVALA